MKPVAFSLLLVASLAYGSEIGQTFQQVVAERGQPVSQIEAGSNRVLKYRDALIKLKDDAVISITPVVSPPPREVVPATQPTPLNGDTSATTTTTVATPVMTITGSTQPLFLQLATLRRARKEAEFRVQGIVNQPVKAVDIVKHMRVKALGSEWYRDGATVPDFNLTDVRATQENKYDLHAFVTTELNPGVAFIGKDLEFNAMTQYFYTDRTLPKKKLTSAEMLEINRLYRLIGQCDQQLKLLTAPQPAAVASRN